MRPSDWPGRGKGEGMVCKGSPNRVSLPLPLGGSVTLGNFPNLSGFLICELKGLEERQAVKGHYQLSTLC